MTLKTQTSTALNRYLQANSYLNEGLIRRGTVVPLSQPERVRLMDGYLDRMGRPERSFRVVHVAGTSGKGSVATMIAETLRAAGIRTGLHVSPYLQVATEKLWVDGSYASADEFADLVDWARPTIPHLRAQNAPAHGIVSVAMALEYFRRQKVDVAVFEAGVGGRFDLSNVVTPAVAVVTGVGPDHLQTLGPSLDDVAWHKAGIIKHGAKAIVYAQSPTDVALKACQTEAKAVGARLIVVGPDELENETQALSMRGAWQKQNAALARAACEALNADSPNTMTEEAIATGIQRARLPARCELLKAAHNSVSNKQCDVILDGAHNPDKLGAIASHLRCFSDRRMHLVFGCLAAKPPGAELSAIAQHATTVTLTEPAVFAKQAHAATQLAESLRSRTSADIAVITNARNAIKYALKNAEDNDLIVATGSLYLAGELRHLWYRDENVLLKRTSWPTER